MDKLTDSYFVKENKILKNKIEQLSKIFNVAPVAICIIDKEGKVRSLNDTCSQLLAYPKEHIIGSHVKDYFLLNTLLDKTMDGFLKSKKHLQSYPCIIQHSQNNELKYIELSVSPLSAQKNTNYICVMVDVTRNKDADRKVLRSTKQMVTLQNISDVVNESLDLGQTLQSVLGEVLSLTGFSAGVVAIVDHFGRKLNPVAFQGLKQRDIASLEQSAPGPKYVEWLSTVSKPLVTVNALNETRLRKCTFREFGYPVIVSVPLRARNKTWGSLSIFSAEIIELSDDDLELLMAIGQQVSIAIENNHLYKAEYEKRRMLQSLVEISAQLCSSLNLETVLNNILELLNRVITFNIAAIIQVSDEAVKIVSTRGEVSELDKLIGHFLETKNKKQTEQLVDLIVDSMAIVKKEKGANIKSFLYNLLLAKGKTIGVVIIGKDEPHYYSEADAQILSAFANFAAIAIENAKLYEQTESELRLREELLREMHHRIRNNLEMLLGLLRMEYSRYSKDNPLRNALKCVIERMESVSTAHTLFSLDAVDSIEADKMLGVSVNLAMQTAEDLDKKLSINYHAHNGIKLPSKKALSTALILNELLTNAVRHGFENGEPGVIQIDLQREDDHICLVVTDNGKGVQPGFNLDAHAGMGLQIVKNLVQRELKGVMDIDSAGKTIVKITYPLL